MRTCVSKSMILTAVGAVLCGFALAQAAVLTTPDRTLPEGYPKPPRITLDGTKFVMEYEGKKTEFVRPMAPEFEAKPAAGGRTLHVAPDGKGTGAEDAPFGSINAAVKAANPGDLVLIGQGEYTEVVNIAKSGLPAKPIIIAAAPGALPRIVLPLGAPKETNVNNQVHPAVFTLTSGAKHIWVNGLVVEGGRGRADSPKQEMYGANGFQLSGKAGEDVRLTNCITYWDLHCGFKEMGHGGANYVIEGCVAFWCGTRANDHGAYIPSSDAVIRGNIFFETAGYGIHAYSHPQRLLIERNLCVRNKAPGIIVSGSNNQVLRNTCVGNSIGMFFFRGGCTNNTVEGNIFSGNGQDMAMDNGGGNPQYGTPSGNKCDYNLLSKALPAQIAKDAQYKGAHDVIGKDAMFADPARGDYRLKDGSPALGAGPAGKDGKPTNLGAF